MKKVIVPASVSLSSRPEGVVCLRLATSEGKDDIEIELSDALWKKLAGDARWLANGTSSAPSSPSAPVTATVERRALDRRESDRFNYESITARLATLEESVARIENARK